MGLIDEIADLIGTTASTVLILIGIGCAMLILLYSFWTWFIPAVIRSVLCDALAAELLRQGYCP